MFGRKKFFEYNMEPVYGDKYYDSGIDSRPKNTRYHHVIGFELEDLIGGDIGSYGQEPGEKDGVRIMYVNKDGKIIKS